MGSVLNDIDDILKEGDVEILRREINDEILKINNELYTKTDLINCLNSKLDYALEKQRRILSEMCLICERISLMTNYIGKTTKDKVTHSYSSDSLTEFAYNM